MSGVPIVVECGADWWMQFAAVDPTNNNAPVAVTNPRMEVRANVFGASSSTAPLLYSSETTPPSIVLTQPSAGVVLATIPAAATKNQAGVVVGFWDAYATDPAGRTIQLGAGPFTSTPNVTGL